jgi:hypothetical protein
LRSSWHWWSGRALVTAPTLYELTTLRFATVVEEPEVELELV